MNPYLILSALVTSYFCRVQGQSACLTPNNVKGECISIYQCPTILNLLSQRPSNQQDRDFLQKSQCGVENNLPKVCCPVPCYAFDGQEGTCVDIHSCELSKRLLQKPVRPANLRYIQNSKCDGGPTQFGMCCTDRDPLPPTPLEDCPETAAPYDPMTECCGVDSGAGNRIYGGNFTTLDQYPWLAIIEYVSYDNKLRLSCGGALISNRYVLTASHCVVGRVLEVVGTPKNVRLGEYDTSNEGPDCLQVEAGGIDCNDAVTIIGIERIIAHPQYNPNSNLRRHDIALLRLRSSVPRTDFIRPICLPTTDVTKDPPKPPRNFTLYAAGWGATDLFNSSSGIKLHVDLPFKNVQQCQPQYNVRNRKVPLWEGQMCAGGEPGKDTCKGDSGGPLMYENNQKWEVIGIVSFGPTPCGLPGIPGVYTKVFEYVTWIRSNIRP